MSNSEKNMSVMKIFNKTLPFFFARIAVYALFALASVLFIGIMIGLSFLIAKMFKESSVALIVLFILTLGGVFGGLRFIERYVLYIVKVAHISVIVELLTTGKVPEGKSQVAHGKEMVTQNFGSANAAFALDLVIAGAVKQIQRWINRIGNVFSFIPGSKNIIGIINAIMSVSLNYIDEAIFSYIILRKRQGFQESAWKSGCDGVVLYAQSWKGILKTSIGSVVFIFVLNAVTFLISIFPLLLLSKALSKNNPELGFFFGIIALVLAVVFMTVIKRAVVDPVVTIAMIRSYQISIEGMQPQVDMHNKLLKVSSKFKNLFTKSQEEDTQIPV